MKKYILLAAVFFYCSIISYAQLGELDSSFGTNGIVQTEFGENVNVKDNIYYARQILVIPDRSIYVTFNGTGITKRHPNGSADSSFASNGFSAISSILPETEEQSQIAIQADG